MNNNSTFAYVHTESGPVKPAKAVPIETMRNIVASIQGKHVRGEKGTNWADLAKKVNKDCNPHGYTTIQTILNKVLTEAAAQSVGKSVFRLDLGNVVCDSAHAKFKMNRRNHSVVVDMLYPNDNGNITIRYNVDDVAAKMFELSLDSEHYINGFGMTIIKCCDDAIKEAEEMTEEEDIYSTENGYQPIMSADMRGLLSIANSIMESQVAVDSNGYGEADFNANPADTGMGDMGAMGGGTPGGEGGQGGGAASLGGNLEKPENEVNFVDFCLGNLDTSQPLDKAQHGSFARLTDILADRMAIELKKTQKGETLTGKQIANGTQGIKQTLDANQKLTQFQEYYPQFKGMVYEKEAQALLNFLERTDVDNAMDFEAWLYSDKTMQELAKRKGVGLQTGTKGDNQDVAPLPSDGTEAAANNTAMDAGMGTGMGGMDAGMGAGTDTGMGAGTDTGMGFDMGTGVDNTETAPAGDGFGGPDINDIGQLDQISENTSEELPNLGGEANQTDQVDLGLDTQPTDENNPPA